MGIARLEEWSVQKITNDPYTPPEHMGIVVAGAVYGRAGFQEGERIRTSWVVSAEGRFITTRSGSRYYLGEVDPTYLEWLKKDGRKFDPDNPITVVGGVSACGT